MKNKILFGLIIAFFMNVQSARANEFGNFPEVKKITKGLPQDAVVIIDRMVECQHWAGEEPYNKERADEINQANEKAKCGQLEADIKALKKKHQKNSKVTKALEKTRNL